MYSINYQCSVYQINHVRRIAVLQLLLRYQYCYTLHCTSLFHVAHSWWIVTLWTTAILGLIGGLTNFVTAVSLLGTDLLHLPTSNCLNNGLFVYNGFLVGLMTGTFVEGLDTSLQSNGYLVFLKLIPCVVLFAYISTSIHIGMTNLYPTFPVYTYVDIPFYSFFQYSLPLHFDHHFSTISLQPDSHSILLRFCGFPQQSKSVGLIPDSIHIWLRMTQWPTVCMLRVLTSIGVHCCSTVSLKVQIKSISAGMSTLVLYSSSPCRFAIGERRY